MGSIEIKKAKLNYLKRWADYIQDISIDEIIDYNLFIHCIEGNIRKYSKEVK